MKIYTFITSLIQNLKASNKQISILLNQVLVTGKYLPEHSLAAAACELDPIFK